MSGVRLSRLDAKLAPMLGGPPRPPAEPQHDVKYDEFVHPRRGETLYGAYCKPCRWRAGYRSTLLAAQDDGRAHEALPPRAAR